METDNAPIEGEAPPEATDSGEVAKPSTEDNAAWAKLRKAEKALKAAEKRIAGFEKSAEEARLSEMSAIEKLKAENESLKSGITEWETKFQTTKKTSAFKIELAKAGCVDSDAACKLADLSSLEITEEGVQGVKEAIKTLQKSKPYLFGGSSPSANGSGGNPSSGAPKVTAKDIARMSNEEYLSYREGLLRGK